MCAVAPRGLRRRSRGARTRTMLFHRDRRATMNTPRTPLGPSNPWENLQGRAEGSSGLRREERSGAMVAHRDRRTTKSVTRTPLCPAGYGGMGPSAVLPLLDRCPVSTSSRRLAYGPMELVTRSPRVLPRTAMGSGGIAPSRALPLLADQRGSAAARRLRSEYDGATNAAMHTSTTGS